jgi:hypothetical protein
VGLLMVVVVPLVAGVVAGVVALLRPPAGTEKAGWRPAWTGLVVGLALAGLVAWSNRGLFLGGFVLAPLVAGGWLAGLAGGEWAVARRPVGAHRSAPLRARRIGDYTPRWSIGLLRGATAGAVALFGVGAALADPLDPRALTTECAPGLVESRGPWPGPPYALPGVVATLVLWAAAEATVRYVAGRPSLPGDDDGRRAVAARTALTAAVLGVVPNIAVLSAVMGGALAQTCGDGPALLGAVIVLGGLVTVVCVLTAWSVAVPPVAAPWCGWWRPRPVRE